MTHNALRCLATALAFLLPFFVLAAEPLIFDSCLDARGNTVPAIADNQQAELVRGDSAQGQPLIRYNPELLPRLDQATRLFLYAHQCARLGLAANAPENSATVARQADCLGLGALLASKLLKREEIPALQAGLAFSEVEWALLPGPPRSVDLASCQVSASGVLRLPLATLPSARQTSWNNCTRACADRLWACQKHCASADCPSCLAPFGDCKSACGAGPERNPAP